MKRSWSNRQIAVPVLDGWRGVKAAQRGRRIRRRAEHERELIAMLPPGVTVEKTGSTTLLLDGYGHSVYFDATHNSVQIPGELGHSTMTPRQVAQAFIWRWKREGCPGTRTIGVIIVSLLLGGVLLADVMARGAA